jgi:hypothetical protein
MLFLLLPFVQLSARNNYTDSTSISDWKTVTGKIEEKEYMGRKAFYLSQGVAYLPGSNLGDGEIEVDIAPGDPMGGITFHMDDSLNYEVTYIRYGRSGEPDALQYCPEPRCELNWQFYPEYQASVTYPKDWIHLKIDIIGKQASVYVLNRDTPVLLVDSLRIPNSSGHVGFWSLRGSYFSNFRYHPLPAETQLSAKIQRKMIDNPDAIKQWWVSESRPFTEDVVKSLNKDQLSYLNWQKAETEPDGFLNINKYASKKIFGRARDNSNDIAWIKYEWDEKSAGVKPLSFEFSNQCFIFFNNNKLFSGNNSFLLKGPQFRGDIDKRMRANTIYLPVKKGRNTLMIAVANITNGWGFMAQFAEPKRQRVE